MLPMGRLFFFAKVHLLLRADQNGIYLEIRGDVFGLGRRVPIIDVRWDEIAYVSRDDLRGRPGIRVFPKQADRFRNRVGVTRTQLPVAVDGSVLILMDEVKAQEMYEVCLAFLHQTAH